MKYQTLVTNKGAQILADISAGNHDKLLLTKIEVGDGSGEEVTPRVDQASLVNKVWEGSIGDIKVAGTKVTVSGLIPASDGGFWMREIGIYDTDGNLILIANMPDTYKATTEEGATEDKLINVVFVIDNVDSISVIIDPNLVSATRSYVDEQLAVAKKYADNQDASRVSKHGDIMDGQLKISAVDALRMFTDGDDHYGIIFRQSEDCFYIIPTKKGVGKSGGIGDLRPLIIRLEDGRTILSRLNVDLNLDLNGADPINAYKWTNNGDGTKQNLFARIFGDGDMRVDLFQYERIGTEHLFDIHVYGGGAEAWFEFTNGGILRVPAILMVGSAKMATDGNIFGTRWNADGEWLWDAITSQLKTRDNNINTRATWDYVNGNDPTVNAANRGAIDGRIQWWNSVQGAGSVGTYALLCNNTGNYINPGDMIAGSSLAWSSAGEHVSSPPSGTWRALGVCNDSGGYDGDEVTLWLRCS